MRPDRIVVGEVRGGEALDMLQAMNTGHDGSITTLHANNPRDCLSRLEMMILMAGVELPVAAMRGQISSAVNVVIQQQRLRDGTRKVTKVTEITGMEGDVISAQDIFQFVATGVDGQGKVEGYFECTGIRPRLIDHLEAAGIHLGNDFFSRREL
jgi:pilus assembly protein CpaF